MGFGDILKTVGGLASFIPGVGTAVGAGANALGSLFGGGNESSNSGDILKAAGIGAGSSLLGSIFSGIGKSNELKKQEELYQKHRKQKLDLLKPQYARYGMEKDLPSIDPAFKKIILGRLSEVLGGERLGKWGVDMESLISGIGGSQPSSQTPGQIPHTPNMPGRFGGINIPQGYADNIMNKYGMRGRGA